MTGGDGGNDVRNKGICAFALCAGAFAYSLAMGGCTARADTIEQLRAQAAQPFETTVEAYGRTIELSLLADVPDAESMGVYQAEYVGGDVRVGTPVYEELPPKQRGIALRTRPREEFTLETLPEDYHAFGHPLSGFEAIDSVWAAIEGQVSQLDGVTARVTGLTGWSPHYYYDKARGEWGDLAVEGSVGEYHVEYEVSLYGAPLLGYRPFYRDQQAYWDENAGVDWMMFVRLDGTVDITQEGEPGVWAWYALPRVTQTLEQDVDFAPLERVYDVLVSLAQEGNLRQAYWLRLCYEGFEYGERPEGWTAPEEKEFLFKPVWVCFAEAYQSPEEEAYEWPDGELIHNEAHIVIDAQTGELIERGRVVSYP